MADLVGEMEREDLLRHHPARYESMNEMLNLTLKHTLNPGRLLQLVFMRDQILPHVQDVLLRLDEPPSVSLLEEIAPQCRAVMARNDPPEVKQANVERLVEMAGTMSMRDLRLELRPPDVATFICHRLSATQIEVTAILTNGQYERLIRQPWVQPKFPA